MKRRTGLLVWCLLLAASSCSARSHADDVDAGPNDTGFDTRELSADTAEFDCATWSHHPRVDPAVADPCNPGGDFWRACTNGDDGLERCLYVETAEDAGVHRWGPCEEACTEAEVGVVRPCEITGIAGVEYCDDTLGRDDHHWQGCQPAACVACTPGETKLCGPGTNYPDTLMRCFLMDGVPYWFDGDCWT